jgi:hypothetical protein
VEPSTLAMTVVSFIAPYLANAGETVAEKAGEAAWEKIKAVYAAVKGKLTGDSYAEQTLKRLEDQPKSPTRQAAMAGILEERIERDSSFGETLQNLLDEAKASGAEKVITQTLKISHARVRDVTQIGEIGRDVNIGKRAD